MLPVHSRQGMTRTGERRECIGVAHNISPHLHSLLSQLFDKSKNGRADTSTAESCQQGNPSTLSPAPVISHVHFPMVFTVFSSNCTFGNMEWSKKIVQIYRNISRWRVDKLMGNSSHKNLKDKRKVKGVWCRASPVSLLKKKKDPLMATFRPSIKRISGYQRQRKQVRRINYVKENTDIKQKQ